MRNNAGQTDRARRKTSEEAQVVGKQHNPTAAWEEHPGMSRAHNNPDGLAESDGATSEYL